MDTAPSNGTTIVADMAIEAGAEPPLCPRVLLADDHRMMAEGLKSLLQEEFELVGIVGARVCRG